ncbi:large ribosomal subunit protein mL54 [Ochlerotatus camptorhynchus]|uniref:large ribosomal subunit protein mL54 n=1 Tax=Ochlerotatus camptorhynchus TaxID=644619 RepID=UPI0031E18CCF
MSLLVMNNMSGLFRRCCTIQTSIVRNYATPKPGGALGSKKKKLGKLGPVVEKKEIPVETDANKLVNYVCGSNVLKTGEDIKLKPDAEYPEWLWSLHVGKPQTLEELDPDSKAYWRKLRRLGLQRNNKLAKLKKF